MLRAVAGGATVIQGGLYLANAGEPGAGAWIAGLIAAASGTALIAGFLTPVSGAAAGLATVVMVATWPHAATSTLFIDKAAAALVLADAAALVLLGPGAHSMDAYLFGRREIIIPHDSNQDRKW